MRDTVWDKAERFLIGLLGAAAMLVGLVQVVGRYIAPRYAISWAEEVIVYLVVWGIMLAASQLVRTDGHVRPDLVLRATSPRVQRWMEVTNCVAAIAFCAGLAWYGWSIVGTSWQLDERSSSDLQFPMWLYSAAVPTGALLMTGRYINRLYRYLFAFDPDTMTVGHIPGHEQGGGLTACRRRTTDRGGGAQEMFIILFLLLFFGLLAVGMPIFLVLGLCAAVLYLVSGEPLIGVTQVVIDHLNSPTLMSLPLFVMAATFMRYGGVAKALVDVSAAWLGGVRGSLGLVTVVACTLFAAISGSSVATALAMGTILLPAMIERGYPRSFALGVVGASGTIGIVIPPSLALILYGIVAEQSVPRLFLAGVLPGLLQAAAFFAWVWYDARRRNFPVEP